jgi:hypothetical protein
MNILTKIKLLLEQNRTRLPGKEAAIAEIERAKKEKVKRILEFQAAGKDPAEVVQIYDEHIQLLKKFLEVYERVGL